MIRPRALGKFEDLLRGHRQESGDAVLPRQLVERRPDSTPGAGHARAPVAPMGSAFRHQNPKPNANRSGLNENYGRELLELHTLA